MMGSADMFICGADKHCHWLGGWRDQPLEAEVEGQCQSAILVPDAPPLGLETDHSGPRDIVLIFTFLSAHACLCV